MSRQLLFVVTGFTTLVAFASLIHLLLAGAEGEAAPVSRILLEAGIVGLGLLVYLQWKRNMRTAATFVLLGAGGLGLVVYGFFADESFFRLSGIVGSANTYALLLRVVTIVQGAMIVWRISNEAKDPASSNVP
jgi:hypothetical protein